MAELTKEQIAKLDTINVIELPDKKMYRFESVSSKGDPLITQTIKSGDTEHAPSADALYKVIGAVYPEWWGAVDEEELTTLKLVNPVKATNPDVTIYDCPNYWEYFNNDKGAAYFEINNKKTKVIYNSPHSFYNKEFEIEMRNPLSNYGTSIKDILTIITISGTVYFWLDSYSMYLASDNYLTREEINANSDKNKIVAVNIKKPLLLTNEHFSDSYLTIIDNPTITPSKISATVGTCFNDENISALRYAPTFLFDYSEISTANLILEVSTISSGGQKIVFKPIYAVNGILYPVMTYVGEIDDPSIINQYKWTLQVDVKAYSYPLITQTIKSGDTEHAPSADALYKVIGAVYPEWWGAVGDGVTDDSDAIQAAIDNAGHIPVVLTSQKGYLVKKTINLIEPFGKEEINSDFGYLNENGSKYNCYQTLIVKHDIIGDASLAGPVIRTGANMNKIEVHGAIVVRNSSDDAVGISCAGTQFKYKPYEPTSGPDNINTGDLGVMQDIKINAIIKGHDSFPYYDASDSAATQYGLGKGTAVLYGGGDGSVLDVRHIYGFENGVWITFANGCTINIGECGCFNDIKIDGTVNTWGGGVTRNKIRLGTHNLNKNWDWVKNAHNNNKDISIIYIASNASVNYSNVECADNEISVGGNNVVNCYCTYNYIVNKVGNSSFTGNKITVSNTLVGSKVAGNWLPVRIKADSFGTRVNNGNRICNDVTFDYDTISINYALNTECSPVIIDGNTHSSCYRFFNSTEEETTRFLLDKVAYTYIKGATVLDGNSNELVKGASKVLFPHYSQLYKCHVVDSVDTSNASTYSKGHLYILKNSTLTDSPQYHAAYGWHNNKFELLGYYVDTFGLIK